MTVDLTARTTSVTRTIPAPAAKIFEVLVDPTLHPVIDGSGSVRSSRIPRDERLVLGSKFAMSMRMGVPYVITNTVTEFEPDRLIAWHHIGRHTWRWELEPVAADDGGESGSTIVTETFDWGTARSPKALEKVGYPARHEANIERSLDRLEAYLTHRAIAL